MVKVTTTPKTLDLLDPAAEARFWRNVLILGADDCWPWFTDVGSREPTGHVRIWHQGERIYAHRLSFLLAGGVIGEGEIVRHLCDNGGCENPRHLLVGTIADNNRDRDIRHRRTPFLPRGERHWSSKLSDQDAARIRAAKQLGLNAHDIAEMFGVSRSTVYSIWAGVRYAPQPPRNDAGSAEAAAA